MSNAPGPRDGGTTSADRRSFAADDVAERAERAEIERVDAPELRTIAPEEIQILAATGC